MERKSRDSYRYVAAHRRVSRGHIDERNAASNGTSGRSGRQISSLSLSPSLILFCDLDTTVGSADRLEIRYDEQEVWSRGDTISPGYRLCHEIIAAT